MRKRKRKHRITWEDAMRVCAWCGKHIPEGSEIFSVNAKTKPGVNLEKEGNVLELSLDAPRKVRAIIPTQESQAKKDGWDLIFAVCSEECARSLKETLQRQISIIDNVVAAA